MVANRKLGVPPSSPITTSLLALECVDCDAVVGALVDADITFLGVRRSLAELLTDASAGDAAVHLLAADVSKPNHMAALRKLKSGRPSSRVVVVAPARGGRGVRQALNAGADGFVYACEVQKALALCVYAAVTGQLSLPRELRPCIAKPVFSHREKQVLAMVVRGYRNGQIAQRLFLAESTIKSHLSSSFEKLGVRSRNEAAALILDPKEQLAGDILGIGLEDPDQGVDLLQRAS